MGFKLTQAGTPAPRIFPAHDPTHRGADLSLSLRLVSYEHAHDLALESVAQTSQHDYSAA